MDKIYTVKVREVHSYEVEVTAESEQEAREKVEAMIEAGDDEAILYPEYEYTLDPLEWKVES